MVESKRKALIDQRHLETYYRVHRLKDVLSHQYATLLREKVQRQRQEMNHNDPDESKVMEGHKEKKRATIQRFTRSTLTHDDTYLRALPKTRHYLILELQRQLTRLRCLKSRKEQEVFRVWVEQHRSTYELEKQLQAMELHSNSSRCVTLESLLKQRSGTPPKLQISPDDTTAQHEHMPVSVRGSGGGANSCQLQGKQSWGQSETELMFPEGFQVSFHNETGFHHNSCCCCGETVEGSSTYFNIICKVFTREIKVPKFSSLHSTFLEKFSTSMLLVRSHEPPIKSKTTGITQHKLRLMHNLSLSHKADTQRIMAKNGLSLQITDGFSIKELMEYDCTYNVKSQKSRCSTEPDLTHLSLRDNATSESPQSINGDPTTKILSLQSAEQRTEDSPSSFTRDTQSSYTEVPLCIDDLFACHAIEVESSDTKMWTNYNEVETTLNPVL